MGLKVANITEEGRFGGPLARIVSVAERLSAWDVETTVILPKNDSDLFYGQLRKSGVNAHRMAMHRLTRDKTLFIRYLLFFCPEIHALRRYLREEGFDVVHCNGAWQVKGLIAGKLAGAKVIWHLNDTRKHKLIRFCFRVLARCFCDGFILAGKRVKKHYISNSSLMKKPSMEIQAPVNTDYFAPDKAERKGGKALGARRTILTVANINPAKGLEYFIEMAHLLNRSFTHLKFVVVGNFFESQRRYFDKLTALSGKLGVENLSFERGVSDVRPFLQKADIYVCSSIHEASPMSVWEAMAMARPIVSTDVGDVATLIKDGEDGFIVAAGDSGALAGKATLLLEDEKIRKKFGNKVLETAIRELDIDICVRKHAEAYRTVLYV